MGLYYQFNKNKFMQKNVGIIVGVIAVVLIAGGIYASVNKTDDAAMMQKDVASEDMMAYTNNATENNDAMMKNESTAKEGDGAMMDKEDTMMKTGTYEAYSSAKLANAAEGDVVLFFRASWCPTCRTLDADIKANLKNIPAGVTVLDVDYDNSTALKAKYGVTYQHTLVQVDKDGNLIKKWSGSPTLASLLGQVE